MPNWLEAPAVKWWLLSQRRHYSWEDSLPSGNVMNHVEEQVGNKQKTNVSQNIVYISAHTCTRTHKSTHTCIHTHAHIMPHMKIHTRARARAHTHTHTHTHAHTHTRKDTHMKHPITRAWMFFLVSHYRLLVNFISLASRRFAVTLCCTWSLPQKNKQVNWFQTRLSWLRPVEAFPKTQALLTGWSYIVVHLNLSTNWVWDRELTDCLLLNWHDLGYKLSCQLHIAHNNPP